VDPILRVAAVYLFLLVLLRLAGRRTLGESTPFDFVVLLLIGDLMQEPLLGEDPSFAHASVLCLTLVGLNIVFALCKAQSRRVERWIEGVPVVLVEHGRPLRDVMHYARIAEEDVLAAARMHQGLERMDQIRLAVLERTGHISVIPESS
jgi:uncharacterized membrane protein YcaP (DUF421 family)